MTESPLSYETSLPLPELSSLVERLFWQQQHRHEECLQQIREDIQQSQTLHQSILDSIDTQICSHRLQLRVLDDRSRVDLTLWLHPRRTQLEQQLSEWHRQRLQQMQSTWEQLLCLRREYRQVWQQLQQSRHTQSFLKQMAEDSCSYLSPVTEPEL